MNKTLFFIIISAVAFNLLCTRIGKAGSDENVQGFAWSENIGWINFNCTNQGTCAGIDYGVDIDNNGDFSGYAWSENIGWINFAPPSPYPASPNYSVKMDTDTGEVSGWARVLSYGGGWDGWIKMRGTNYGVSINTTNGDFSGYAWSDMVIGWINFQGVNYKVKTTFSFNVPPNKPTSENVTWSSGCTYTKAIPTFNWAYSDPDNVPVGTDSQTSYQIRVDNDPTFQIDANDNAILDSDEFRCGGTVCSGGASQTFSPMVSSWISWADHDARYYWKVRVKDSNNTWSVWSNLNSFYTPVHTYPDPDFIHTPESPSANEEVQFTDTSTCYNSSNEPYLCKVNASNRYVWDFGDGEGCDSNVNSSCRGDVVHSYLELGGYTVILRITDNVGACLSQGDTPINAAFPLPEYEEVPPVIFLEKFLANILEFFRNMLIY